MPQILQKITSGACECDKTSQNLILYNMAVLPKDKPPCDKSSGAVHCPGVPVKGGLFVSGTGGECAMLMAMPRAKQAAVNYTSAMRFIARQQKKQQ
jgi:hypothetical protein